MLMSLLCLLMTTAFMSATANRDISTGMDQFIFSSPISRRRYFFGKFFGAVTLLMIPLLGVSVWRTAQTVDAMGRTRRVRAIDMETVTSTD
ncbi:MAG: hypothetical protein IPM83_11805 [Ignavibacteria bacterium]|nr:hypothetical protein [Ignavibacteria bacterium]